MSKKINDAQDILLNADKFVVKRAPVDGVNKLEYFCLVLFFYFFFISALLERLQLQSRWKSAGKKRVVRTLTREPAFYGY